MKGVEKVRLVFFIEIVDVVVLFLFWDLKKEEKYIIKVIICKMYRKNIFENNLLG